MAVTNPFSPRAPLREPWDDKRVEALGPALLLAANTARIGLAVVVVEPPEPRVVYMSDVGAEIIGHPKQSILNRPAISFLTSEEREAHRAGPDVNPDIPADRRSFETMVMTSDRRQVPVEVTLAPLELDGEFIVVVFFRDISDRHRSIEALRQSEERFRALVELAPDAVWINDGERLAFVNPATVRMLGYDTTAEVLALDPRDIVHPDDHASMLERSREMWATGHALPPREYRTRRRDGSIVLTELQSMPIEWEGRKAILGFARDVTARKEMEAQLIRSDRLAALGTLLAGIAHEMNNPLAYVLLGIEQAFARVDAISAGGEDLGRLREVLQDVRSGAARVAAVVRQLRESARPDGPERGMVDVGAALLAALRVAGNEIRHRAHLVTALEPIPPIDGNAQRLEQVFLNLLVNATQALPEGRAGNEIDVKLRAQRDAVVVEISDNGSGIPEAVLPRIFDPFFTTKPVGVGMGLGLSICHGIVTSHGGTIEVESKPGRGTKFRVSLPARRSGVPAAAPVAWPAASGDAAAGAAAAAASATAAARRRRILVVDDEPALGAMIQRMLKEDSDVDVATDGRQGLARLAGCGCDYDIILCDIMMPEMTGMELYSTVAARYPGRERRFIFMTGGAFTSRATDFLASVRNPQLDKPFDLAALRAIVAGC
jgi:PAS domain S-box-containing protein